jgi:hypothetical protein
LQQVELRAFYSSGGINSDTIPVISFSQSDFDSNGGVLRDIEITSQQLADVLSIPGGVGSLLGGDSFTLLNYTTLTNGITYPSPTVNGNTNVTPNVNNATATTSFTSNITVFVGCPSDQSDFVGTYSAEITACSGAFGPIFLGNSVEGVTITFAGPEPFRYLISDITAESYVAFGGTAYPGNFYDICGDPAMLPAATFGVTVDTGGGIWDPDAGTLTLNVHETNNDIFWTIVFTKE